MTVTLPFDAQFLESRIFYRLHKMGKFLVDPLRCLIIDDEQPAHQVLGHHIEKIPWLQTIGNLENAVEALVKIPILKADIIFLDVQMPNLSGLQLLDILHSKPAHIILTSAHAMFAIEGYQYDVDDFLLKPIPFDKFLKAVNKIRLSHQPGSRIKSSDTGCQPEALKAILKAGGTTSRAGQYPTKSAADSATDALWVKAEKTLHRISLRDIKFIEAQKNYVQIHCGADQIIQTRSSLAEIENKLPPESFIRTHKSYIVNSKAIKQISGNTITLDNSYRVSISPSERETVFKLLKYQA